jgi:2-dehydropantoate 2-reductase
VISVKPPVVESVRDLVLRPDDVLLLCVKSQDSAPLLADLASLPVGNTLAAEALPLVCVQNGTYNETVALRFFRNVHGVALMLQATHLMPGRVSASGSPVTGILEIGRYPSGHDQVDEQISKDLNGCGFLVDVRDDVMEWKRAKLIRNLRNVLEGLCGPQDQAHPNPTVDKLREAAVAEARACFAAASASVVTAQEWNDRYAPEFMRSLPVEGQARAGGSTWQSLSRGLNAVETDYLNGEIVQLGRLHNVPTPVNERLQLAMADFLQRGAAAGSLAPETLV